jgi:hypothetical protein
MKVNELTSTQTIDLQNEILALTDEENNVVELATVETLLNSVVSSDSDNSLGFKQGKLFVDVKAEQPINTLNGSGSIQLESNTINRVTVSGALEFTLPVTVNNAIYNQILVQVDLSTYYNVTLGTTYTFNGVLPALTEAGKYNLIYEYDGANWYVGIMNKGEIS